MDEPEATQQIQVCPHCRTIFRDDAAQTIISTSRELIPESELDAKMREFHELMNAYHEPKTRALAVAWSMKDDGYIREQMLAFHTAHGRWPEFKGRPGGGVEMESLG